MVKVNSKDEALIWALLAAVLLKTRRVWQWRSLVPTIKSPLEMLGDRVSFKDLENGGHDKFLAALAKGAECNLCLLPDGRLRHSLIVTLRREEAEQILDAFEAGERELIEAAAEAWDNAYWLSERDYKGER